MNLDLSNAKKTTHPSEIRINCPYCGDSKYHMYVNVDKRLFHCFRCQSSGYIDNPKGWFFDLRKLQKRIDQFLNPQDQDSNNPSIELPKEYLELKHPPKNYWEKVALSYLRKRGLTYKEIQRYKIGYCAYGFYEKRLIIPFIFEGKLEYFISRAFVKSLEPKYLNPKSQKKNILFYSRQKPSETAVICEGVFDAISIDRVLPAIALLGKEMSSDQFKRIISTTKKVVVMLDPDAMKWAISIYFKLRNHIEAFWVDMSRYQMDPGEMSPNQIKEVLNAYI